MARTKINSDQMAVSSEFENRTNGALGLADAEIANAKLVNDSVTVTAGSGLTGGGEVDLGASVTLDINPDDASLEVDSDVLRVKALGVAGSMLAADSVTADKIGDDEIKREHLNADVRGPGIVQNANGSLELSVDDSSIELNVDELRVKADGIGPSHIHANVAGAGIGQNPGDGSLELVPDNSSVELNGDQLRVKGLGIANSMLAADAVTEAKIADDAVRKEHLNADVVGDGLQQDGDGHIKARLEGASLEISNQGVRIKDGAVAGTANQLALAYNAGIHTMSFTTDVTMPGDVTVTGSLIVNGTSTTVESTTMAVEDNMIEVGKDNAANSLDLGFYGQYNDGSERYAGLFRKAGDGQFHLFDSLTVTPGNTVATADGSYDLAELKLDKVFGNIQYADVRTFALSGDLGGSATFNGSDDPTIAATIQDDAVQKTMIHSDVAGAGIGQNADGSLELVPDNVSVELNGDQLRVKALGIAGSMLAADSITADKIGDDEIRREHLNADVRGPGIVQNANGSLELSVDDASIELNVDELRIKDNGVVTSKILDSNVTNAKLENDSLTFTYNGLSGPGGAQALGSSIAFSIDQFGESFAQGDMTVTNTRFTLTPGGGKSVADNLKPMVFLNGICQEEGAGADYVWDSANGHITFADGIDGDDRGQVVYFRKPA